MNKIGLHKHTDDASKNFGAEKHVGALLEAAQGIDLDVMAIVLEDILKQARRDATIEAHTTNKMNALRKVQESTADEAEKVFDDDEKAFNDVARETKKVFTDGAGSKKAQGPSSVTLPPPFIKPHYIETAFYNAAIELADLFLSDTDAASPAHELLRQKLREILKKSPYEIEAVSGSFELEGDIESRIAGALMLAQSTDFQAIRPFLDYFNSIAVEGEDHQIVMYIAGRSFLSQCITLSQESGSQNKRKALDYILRLATLFLERYETHLLFPLIAGSLGTVARNAKAKSDPGKSHENNITEKAKKALQGMLQKYAQDYVSHESIPRADRNKFHDQKVRELDQLGRIILKNLMGLVDGENVLAEIIHPARTAVSEGQTTLRGATTARILRKQTIIENHLTELMRGQ